MVVSFGNIRPQSASLSASGDAVCGMRPQQHCGAKLMQSALSASGSSHPESKVSVDIAVCSLSGSQRHRHVTYHVWPLLLMLQPAVQVSIPEDPLAFVRNKHRSLWSFLGHTL